MSGVLGLTRPSGGARDLTGSKAVALNLARQRLLKGGRPAESLTVADLDQEVRRYARERSERVRDQAAIEAESAARRAAFYASLRSAEPGQEIGPDEQGHFWRVEYDGSLSDLGAR